MSKKFLKCKSPRNCTKCSAKDFCPELEVKDESSSTFTTAKSSINRSA